ncbi:MAG TPA: GNAT family N-acetyltransferase [Thermoproteota archaeon]|nr:GNAT family N-acetyltransferase [Thermoproteota archaeon]
MTIEAMLNPRSIALIGATEREGSVGQALMSNLLPGRDKRAVYPVNPSRKTVMGLECYPTISAVPSHVDLAVVATPSKTVPPLADECGRAGVDGIVIVSAGFREIGQEGLKLEKQLTITQAKYGMRILGPNCIGFIRPHAELNASFLKENPEPGEIGFVSQSGAIGTAILDWAVSTHVGFSFFVSLGSMLDIGFGDMIDYLGSDPKTRSILIYMESVQDARKFMSAARGFARTKPIIVIKAGKHLAGAKAAHSHTGALAGDYEVYDAALKRAGVVRVDEIDDLFNCASVLESRYLPEGPELGIVTNAGGPAVLAADSIADRGLGLAKLSEESVSALDKCLPPYWSKGNPVDILGDADISRYEAATRICMADPDVDGLLVIYTPQGAASSTELAEIIAKMAAERSKPVLTTWMGMDSIREAREVFYKHDIPTYPTPEQAIKTYMYMHRYKRNLELLYQTPEELAVDLSPPKSHLELLVRKTAKEGRTVLSSADVDKFLDAYDIPRPNGSLATNVEEACDAASSIGYPVVLKIASQDLTHKTDVGGVVVGVESEQRLREEFTNIVDRARKAKPDAKIDGVYVQEMIRNVEYELILGSKKDVDFGAVILFGQGGIGVELFKDFSVGLPPLNQVLARRVIEETRIYEALSKGLRNKRPVDLRSLEQVMVRFSNMIVDFPEIAEMDINPLIVAEDKLWAVDSRIIIEKDISKYTEPYQHLVVMPYPSRYVTPWKLKDGTEVTLRPIRPEDEPIELEFIRGLSEESSRFRFFQVIRDLPHEALVRFCNIDYDREMAFIAETREANRRIEIGVGRLIMDPDKKRGEFAVVVADKYQGKGLGTKLIDMLISVAEEKGLGSIYGIVLPENANMIHLCEKLGFTVERKHEEVMVELKLG